MRVSLCTRNISESSAVAAVVANSWPVASDAPSSEPLLKVTSHVANHMIQVPRTSQSITRNNCIVLSPEEQISLRKGVNAIAGFVSG
jgi:hypothetical protein